MEEEEKPEMSMVEQAKAAAMRMEAANKKMEENMKRMEELQARMVLGGNSQAGQEKPKPREETPVEYKNRIMRGELKNEEGKY